MTLRLADLRPYKSLLVCRLPENTELPRFLGELADDILKVVKASPVTQSATRPTRPETIDGLHTTFFHYTESRPVTWTTDSSVVDTLHQLVVLCARTGHTALFFSDTALRDRVLRRVESKDGTRIGVLSRVPPGLLNAAFVKGETHTLWLSGTHRRVPSKVDNKVISGSDLRFALDPLGDQTYFFTSARSRLRDAQLARPVGVTPRGSRICAGTSADWLDFRSGASRLLELLAAEKKPRKDPLPVLAIASTDASDLKGIGGAYDAALIPPELLDPVAADPDEREHAEELGRLGFEITKSKGADFVARVVVNDAQGSEQPLGEFQFKFDLSRPTRPSWFVSGTLDPRGDKDKFEAVEETLARHRSWLKVWYDSGHTLLDETFVVLRYRDEPFDGYLWEDLRGANVKKEKPDPVAAVGTQDSLFCWVKDHWRTPGAPPTPEPRGWLACDDGAMEIADFIHLDTDTTPPTLGLIHVKAAKSKEPHRPISVSDYEIVTGQAVKNLRYLDGLNVSEGLEVGLNKRIGKLVWRHGKPSDRKALLADLGALGANYQRLVVIVQPRATKAAVERARGNLGSPEHARLTQLDTLLLGARANCQALGARLYVVGDDSDAATPSGTRKTR